MGKERWNERLAKLRALLVAKARPVTVAPKHHISGPYLVPSDRWTDPERQRHMGPQCQAPGCHQNLVFGQELVDGKFCGQCAMRYSIPRRLAMGGGDLPPAA